MMPLSHAFWMPSILAKASQDPSARSIQRIETIYEPPITRFRLFLSVGASTSFRRNRVDGFRIIMPVTTPVIVPERRIRLDSVMFKLRTREFYPDPRFPDETDGSGAAITYIDSIEVFDGINRISDSEIRLRGNVNFESGLYRHVVESRPQILWGVSFILHISVEIDNSTRDSELYGEIVLNSFGADFF